MSNYSLVNTHALHRPNAFFRIVAGQKYCTICNRALCNAANCLDLGYESNVIFVGHKRFRLCNLHYSEYSNDLVGDLEHDMAMGN